MQAITLRRCWNDDEICGAVVARLRLQQLEYDLTPSQRHAYNCCARSGTRTISALLRQQSQSGPTGSTGGDKDVTTTEEASEKPTDGTGKTQKEGGESQEIQNRYDRSY